MSACTTPRDTRARLAALACAAALIAGCGSDSASPPPAAPPPSPSDFLFTTRLIGDAGQPDTLLVFDPAALQTPRLSVPLSKTENHLFDVAFHFASDGSYTLYGESMAFYVKGGQVFQVSLRKADATTPQRITSLTTACALVESYLDWLAVTEAGPDGQCATETDNRTVFARVGASTTAAAVSLPVGVALLDALPDAAYSKPLVYLARDTRDGAPRLTVYGPDLTPLGDLAGGQGLSDVRLVAGAGALLQTGAWAYAGGALRRIAWSASGATLMAASHTFAHPPADADAIERVGDTNSLYFLDGLAVMRIDGTGAPQTLTTLDPGLGDVASLGSGTADHLVLLQSSSSGAVDNTLLRVAKQGGARQTVVTGSSIYPAVVSGDDLLYQTYTWATPGYKTTVTLRRIGLDGTNDRVVVEEADQFLLPAYGHTFSLFDFRPEGFVWCERAAGEDTCRNGTLKSLDLRTNTVTVLGQVSPPGDSSQYVTWHPFGEYTGTLRSLDSPWVLQSRGWRQDTFASEHDLFTIQPLVANSLAHLAH